MKKKIQFVIGIFIVAFIFNLFYVPNNLAATGVSGLSIVLGNFINIDKSLFVGAVNLVLILISFIFLGKESTYNTIVGSLLLPFFIKITSYLTGLIDISSVDLLIKAVVGGIVSGYGLGLVFKSGYTTGGTDIIEAVICKYFHMSMDKSIILVDGFVVLLTGFVFGIEHLIYALIILVCQSIYSNRFMLEIKEDKILFINSKKHNEIIKFLKETYNYGISILDGVGGYSDTMNKILMVSVRYSYYLEIKEAILLIDPNAFITVCNSHETVYLNKEERSHNKKVILDK